MPDGRALTFADAVSYPTPRRSNSPASPARGRPASHAHAARAARGHAVVLHRGSAEHPRGEGARGHRSPAPGAVRRTSMASSRDAALKPGWVRARLRLAGGRARERAGVPPSDAGNIGYKLVQRLAGAGAGPILRARRQANDPSRAASRPTTSWWPRSPACSRARRRPHHLELKEEVYGMPTHPYRRRSHEFELSTAPRVEALPQVPVQPWRARRQAASCSRVRVSRHRLPEQGIQGLGQEKGTPDTLSEPCPAGDKKD
jgi:hypothetical protein